VARVATDDLAPRILARPEHTVSRSGISPNAVKVLYRLLRSGYTAYLVGGSVRDLLIGGKPKDFDVATNARPQEIRRLFRNSRIIGRRFRLVHIFFKDEIVEVATFRASPEPPEGPDDWEEAVAEAADADAEVDRAPVPPRLESTAFGTPAEDALRRDFTINGLFYDISDFSVVDYVGGLEDLEARKIRTIGEPELRFREDPVRMLRALEYAARLDFEIERRTLDAISQCRDEITGASAARLSYELFETLRSGSSAAIYAAWHRAGLFELAFPGVGERVEDTIRTLGAIDAGIARGERYPDPALIAALFLQRFYRDFADLTRDGAKLDNVEMLRRIAVMLEPAATNLRLANHTLHLMAQGLFTLSKMHHPPDRGRQVLKLARHDYFDATMTLYGLAAAVGLVPNDAFQSWSKAVARIKAGTQAPPEDEPPPARTRRRRPRRRRRR
jgi:poly(A) polymerase